MRKQASLAVVAGFLLFSACKKEANAVVPNDAKTSLSSDTTTRGTNSCNGKPQGPPPPPEKVMKDLDADNNRLISRSEAKGPLLKDFDRLDTNKDDSISLEELKAGPPKN